MSKYVVVYDDISDYSEDVSFTVAREFDSELDLVNWLLRWASIFPIVAVSKSADFHFDGEVYHEV